MKLDMKQEKPTIFEIGLFPLLENVNCLEKAKTNNSTMSRGTYVLFFEVQCCEIVVQIRTLLRILFLKFCWNEKHF